MRRPQVSSEKQDYKNSCHAQSSSGAFARVRRFLAVSIGGQDTSRTIATIKRPCDSLSPPTSQSFSNLRAEAETVLGRSLQDLLREDVKNPPQGVPTFLHEICCHMLTHGVDFETLVSEDWCPDRAALLEGLPHSLVVGDFSAERRGELTAVAALFRLFLHELPHPLIGRDVAATLGRICKELERYDEGRDLELFQELAMRVRSVLFRNVPSCNLSLLQYLTTFLHQVHSANHNKCPVDQTSLSRLLTLVLTEEGMKDETNQSAQRIAEMILLNHTLIFGDSVQYSQDTNYSSDSVSSNCDSRGETTDEADLFTPDDDDVDDDDDDEADGSDRRRQNISTDDAIEVEDDSSTSTTTDTDEFRSPPVSPIKISGEHQDPGTSSPVTTRKLFLGARCPRKSLPVVCDVTGASLPPPLDSSSPVTPDPKAPPSLFPSLGAADPTSPGTSSSKSKKCSPFSFENFLKNRSKNWGLKETFLQRKRKGRADEGSRGHDPKALRSTDEVGDREGFISKLGPYGREYLPSITGLLTSPYDSWNVDILRSEEDIGSQHKFEPSATESSCISGEEVSELDDESEEDRDADGSDTEGVAPSLQCIPCPHEERRSSERYFPRSHHSSSGRKTKRKHRKKHFKDSNSRVQSSEEEEREISSTSVFASLLSRDEPPATFDPTPPESSQSFSALLSSEEPIPSYRSSWGGERQEVSLHDNWQRTAPHYNREDVDNSMKSVNWYRDEDIDLDSYRKSNFGDPSLIGDPLDDVGSRIRGHSAVKLLTKNVNGLKKKIKKFEEEFEKSFGYRPSHADKMKHKDIKKYMADLSKAKKELKQMKEDVPEKKVRSYQKPFPISLLRCQESTNVSSVTQTPSSPSLPNKITKETYRQVEERLSVKRTEAGRPTKVADLSLDQLKEEKTDIQKALLFYESVHGRPNTREDKELVRPLYDRYRLVKRSVNKLITRPKENIAELPPIIEHVVMDFTLASPQHRGSLKEEDDSEEEESAISALPLNPDPHPEVVPTPTPELNLGDLHALPIHELKERKKEAREEKRRLRHSLREYEERFERETGRKMQKEDRGPMEKNYNEYKHVKAKLRLLEALLSKHAS